MHSGVIILSLKLEEDDYIFNLVFKVSNKSIQ